MSRAMRWLLACAAVLAAGELGDPGGSEEKRDAVLPFTAGGAVLPVRAARPRRYLLYDVNPGEGFNLRRDVYMRVAALLQKLVKAEPWVLVLPPWGRLYHWQSRSLTQQQQQRIPWSAFFNAPSLAAHVPVIEYEEYLKENGGPFIEQVFYLQSYAEGWTEGKWEEKVDVRPCVEKPVYRLDEHGYYRGWFWGYPETRAKNVTCLSVQGMASIMVPVLLRNTSSRSVMLDRAENLLHDEYGQKAYWDARRSMVFARPLRAHADEFRAQHLNSTDATDKTVFQEDWKKTRVKVGTAVGGPYLAAHLRRKDFLYGHSGDVPSLKASASTLRRLMQQLKLPRVFIATDADRDEVRELQALLPEMVRFEPSQGELHRFLDGGVAIIDQWICAHARDPVRADGTRLEATQDLGTTSFLPTSHNRHRGCWSAAPCWCCWRCAPCCATARWPPRCPPSPTTRPRTPPPRSCPSTCRLCATTSTSSPARGMESEPCRSHGCLLGSLKTQLTTDWHTVKQGDTGRLS